MNRLASWTSTSLYTLWNTQQNTLLLASTPFSQYYRTLAVVLFLKYVRHPIALAMCLYYHFLVWYILSVDLHGAGFSSNIFSLTYLPFLYFWIKKCTEVVHPYISQFSRCPFMWWHLWNLVFVIFTCCWYEEPGKDCICSIHITNY